MAQTVRAPNGQAQGVPERLRLARIARQVVLSVPGVHDLDAGAGGLHVTVAAGQSVEGVVCAAARDGGYEVAIRLIADVVPLQMLGGRVQDAVRRAARTTGVALSGVTVHVAGVWSPGDDRAAA
jgi:hypothetical protein